MSTHRRFDDREIATIFERAGARQDALANPGHAEGLTLAELQAIGAQVGIEPAHIADAAHAVATGALVPTARRSWWGLPVAVARTIEFQRPVSDAEWSQLVVTLRETFDARGQLTADGPFRQWTNGNLQALLEPTPTGHRLRLSTRKGDARVRVWMGLGYLALGGFFAMLASQGMLSPRGASVGPLLLGAVGALSLVSAAVGLPRWARTRAQQMESVAAQAARLVLPAAR